jgi:IclR family transcriptional regulator, acetate operon repressor
VESKPGARARNPVGRAFEILAWLAAADGRPAGPREIARELAMTPSTVHRLLSQLEDGGLIRRVADGRYELGLEFLRVAWLASGGRSLREIALPFMRDLVARAGETALLAQYEPARGQACVVAAVESDEPFRFVSGLYEWRPLHAGALGRAILAFLPQGERMAIVAGGLERMTAGTLTEPGALERSLADTRERGYAVSIEERRAGGVGLAAPVFAPGRRAIASVGLALPVQRFEPGGEPALSALILECAARVSEGVGGP